MVVYEAFDDEESGYVVIRSIWGNRPLDHPLQRHSTYLPGLLPEIDRIIDEDHANQFWPVNKKIHDNPEQGYEEFIAHDALTGYMDRQEGWEVTRSAYGIKTAWVAVYDSGLPGPVVSFNAEMGEQEHTRPVQPADVARRDPQSRRTQLTSSCQTASLESVTRAVTTSLQALRFLVLSRLQKSCKMASCLEKLFCLARRQKKVRGSHNAR
jgi:hypothetical protein